MFSDRRVVVPDAERFVTTRSVLLKNLNPVGQATVDPLPLYCTTLVVLDTVKVAAPEMQKPRTWRGSGVGLGSVSELCRAGLGNFVTA